MFNERARPRSSVGRLGLPLMPVVYAVVMGHLVARLVPPALVRRIRTHLRASLEAQ